MAKELSDYSTKELEEIGRKVLAAQAKTKERDQKKAAILKKLWEGYKSGKFKI